jgi:formylglycine-generating enzyme required for sulfatase activity
MKKLIPIGVLLACAAVSVGCGRSDEYPGGETKIFTLPGGVRMEMVYVAPGSFQMGSENGEDGGKHEKPVHRVTLTKGFWIGKYPITQAQWNALVSAMEVRFEDRRPVAGFSKNGVLNDIVSGMDTSDFPMETISWDDCKALVDALNKADREGVRWSLPTEAPQGPASGVYRVLRGGGWGLNARICRSAFRFRDGPGVRSIGCGFRLCCSAGPRE